MAKARLPLTQALTHTPSNMDANDPRLSLQESLELIRVDNPGSETARYMSTRPAWVPGSDLPWDQTPVGEMVHTATYGAHVYAMAAAAVLRAAAEGGGSDEMGLHVSLVRILHPHGAVEHRGYRVMSEQVLVNG